MNESDSNDAHETVREALIERCHATKAPQVERIFAFLDDTMDFDGGHDPGHLVRVLESAHTIFESESGESETLADDGSWRAIACAALLHDLVNLPKNHPERHLASTKSADAARSFVLEADILDADEAERMHEAIRSHSFSAGLVPESFEARVLHDADRLEAIGAIGIARTFCVSGLLDRPLFHPTDPLNRHREPDDAVWGLDHFFCKLLEVRDSMTTDAGRQMASERHQFLERFLDQIERELLPESRR